MTVFLAWLVGILILPGMIGLLVLFHIFRPQKAPADRSNRIGKIKLVWLALNREYLFVDLFPWLKNDVLDNLKQ